MFFMPAFAVIILFYLQSLKMVCFVSFGVLDLARELIKVQIDRFSCNLFLSYYNAFFDRKRILRV